MCKIALYYEPILEITICTNFWPCIELITPGTQRPHNGLRVNPEVSECDRKVPFVYIVSADSSKCCELPNLVFSGLYEIE